jgi:hypothetical protein
MWNYLLDVLKSFIDWIFQTFVSYPMDWIMNYLLGSMGPFSASPETIESVRVIFVAANMWAPVVEGIMAFELYMTVVMIVFVVRTVKHLIWGYG